MRIEHTMGRYILPTGLTMLALAWAPSETAAAPPDAAWTPANTAAPLSDAAWTPANTAAALSDAAWTPANTAAALSDAATLSDAAAPGVRPVALTRPAVADPVAMVVRVTGTVRVQRAAGGPSEQATVGMRLMAGDRLTFESGAQAIILYVSGRRETVTQSLAIAAPQQAERANVFDRTVSTLNAVASADARQQPNRQGMIRPIAGAATLLSPRNDIKVVGLRPTFVWSSVPGATGYTIQIRSEDGITRKRFEVGTDTVWAMPASAPPLAPGARYHWTIAPAGSGRAAEEKTFRTLSAEEYAALEQGMVELRQAQLDPWSDGLFLAALIFRDRGLFYEADRALRQLQESGTPLGQPYYLLRGEVYDALGMLDDAALAFDHAGQIE